MVADVIIPAFNEADSIAKVIQDIPKQHIRQIIVCNNGSTDQTSEKARNAGAVVIDEKKKGYGYACLAGITFLKSLPEPPEIVVFLDGDYSDFPPDLPLLTRPIHDLNYDLVIGSRVQKAQPGSITLQQKFGNKLATSLIRVLYGYRFSDLGPFRAIRWETLLSMDMQDMTYGWTVEMQVKAAQKKLKCIEVPVSYRPRIGRSKVSGTLKGTIAAGYKILWTILKLHRHE